MKKRFTRNTNRLAAWLLAIIMVVTTIPEFGPVIVQAKGQSKEEGYQVTYKIVSTWSRHATIDLTIENTGEEPLENWSLAFDYLPDITSMWNGDISSQEDNTYTIIPKPYNTSLAAGASITIGFMAEDAGETFAEPQNYVLHHDGKEKPDSPKKEPEFSSGLAYPKGWEGLRYALLTGSETDTDIKAGSLEVTGDVHSNAGFHYTGGTLAVSGILSTVGSSTIAVSDNGETIGYKKKHAKKVSMPDLTKQLKETIQTDGKTYDSDKKFGESTVNISNSIYIDGTAEIHTTQFTGKGILYAKDSIVYNVGELATPEDSRLFLCSENGDITLNGTELNLNAVVYAPNGCVTINAGKLNLNGRIIAQNVVFNGTDIKLNSSDKDYEMLDFLLKKEISIEVSGEKKVNRKITLDAVWADNGEKDAALTWEIMKIEDGREQKASIAVDEEASGKTHKELLFCEAGDYVVRITGNNSGNTCMKEEKITIAADEAPVANFVTAPSYLRNKTGIAEVMLQDASYSPDGDTISHRTWTIYYDQNNNGKFEDEEAEVISDKNETSVTYRTKKVGNYKVELTVQETFEATIPALLTDGDYRKGNTGKKEEKEKKFLVDNEAPEAAIEVSREKAADIVFTVGEATKEELAAYNAGAAKLKAKLKETGIDARISTATTSTLTAKDTFAWEEHDHYKMEEEYGETLDKHIIYDGNDIKMLGYTELAGYDYLYVEDKNNGIKQFEFDLEKDETNWHSMYGGGFLFDVNCSEEDNTISMGCVLVRQTGIEVRYTKQLPLDGFLKGLYTPALSCDLVAFQRRDTSGSHHIKIQADDRSVTVWDGEEVVMDHVILPEKAKGYGYGPITCNKVHSCSQRSYFTFRNITMTTTTGEALSDILDNYKWRDGAAHYVIHLNNEEVEELSDPDAIAEMTRALVSQNATFAGIGNEKNEESYRQLLNAMGSGGMMLSNKDVSSAVTTINDYILADILNRDYSVKHYVTTEDRISYGSYYSDEEKDPLKTALWEYEYDPDVFGESGKEHSKRTEKKPILQFPETGAYTVKVKVQDDPTGGNEALSDYCKWSDTEECQQLILVQNRPIAKVTAEVVEDEKDPASCIAKVNYESYDPDHSGQNGKGIRKEQFYYKNVKDAEWREGRLPNRLVMGETYLVKYIAEDMEGSLSRPAVMAVKTSELEKWQPQEDEIPPEITISVSKEEAEVGEAVLIDTYAVDDCGVKQFSLYVDGKQMLQDSGRVLYTGKKEGTVTIRAEAEDTCGNKAEQEKTIRFVDNRDCTPPEITITSPVSGNDIAAITEITGSITDDRRLKEYKVYYRARGSQSYTMLARGNKEVRDGVIASWDTGSLTEGTYELCIRAEDENGNTITNSRIVTIVKIEEEEETKPDNPEEPQEDEEPPYIEYTGAALNQDHTRIEIRGTITDDKKLKNYILTYQPETGSSKTITEGEEAVKDGLLGSIETEGLSEGTYIVTARAEDEAGNYSLRSMQFTYRIMEKENQQEVSSNVKEEGTGGEDKPVPAASLAITLNRLQAGIGQSVLGLLTIPENIDKKTLKVTTQGEALAVKNNYVTYVGEKTGRVTFLVTAKDTEGKEQKAEASCQFFNLADTAKPTAEFSSPKGEAVLTEPTDIVGTAWDEEGLDYYRVEYAPKGTGDWTVLEEGKENQKNEVLARLDTTCVPEGIYTLRLSVQDEGGNRVMVERNIVVESGLKIGAMNVGFTDLKETVSGVGLSISRNYSSINKTSGDFGYGWTMGLSGMKLYKSNEIAENWVMGKEGNLLTSRYTMKESVGHDIIIRYEDGTSDRFKAVLNPSVQAYAPILSTRMTFTCETNQKRKLAIDGDNLALTSQSLGENYLFGEDEDYLFEPENFILTLEDGTKVYLNAGRGVTRIEDKNGNYVKVTKNGYEHSDGKGVTFTRDNSGRITEISDTAGNQLTYTYDKAGNLSTYTDQAGRTVSYTYDGEHNLTGITDPMGIAVARNEYDETGKLVAVVDAYGNRTEYEYDMEAGIQQVTDAMGAITTYTYDQRGNILSQRDALGNTTNYTYDEHGNKTSVTDANGNTTTYTYDSMGNVTEIQYPDKTTGRTQYNSSNLVTSASTLNREIYSLCYDEADNITSQKDGEGNQTEYAYTTKGNIKSMTDAIGIYQKLSYDKEGNVKTMTDGNGTEASMSYDKNGNCLSVTVREKTEGGIKNYTREYTYDAAGNQTSSTDPEGNVTTHEYDADGRKTADIDAQGQRTSYVYDDAGNLIQTNYEDGTQETFVYDALGNNTKATDRNGQTITMTYDKLSRMTAKTDALGNRTTYEYDAVGNLLKETKANGAVTTYTYDSRNRNTSITDALGHVTTYTYTENSQLETATDALGNVTRYRYDNNGNCVKTTYADGTTICSDYDARGRRTAQTDASGNRTIYSYDGADHLIRVTDALGKQTSYTYDETGSLSKVTDANGNTTTYEYDGNGRNTKTTNGAGNSMTKEYDALGNVVRSTDYKGTETTYEYNRDNRLVKKTCDGRETCYTYNKHGMIKKVTDETGTISYDYDSHDQLTGRTDARGITVNYSYDRYGRKKNVTTPYEETRYTYDLLDRVIRIEDRKGNTTTYEYDANGNRKTQTSPNGITTAYTYDVCGRLTKETVKNKEGNVLTSYQYTLDKNGNRTKIEETDTNGENRKTEYSYDALNRLTKEKTAKGENSITSRYAYDAASNRILKDTTIEGNVEELADVKAGIWELTEGSTTYTYNSLNQLVTEKNSRETRTYTYDKNGSLIGMDNSREDGKKADYDYDAQQRLIRATLQQGNTVEITSYTYDYEGNRTGKAKDDTEYTYYVNDTQSGYTQVLAETDEKGQEEASYTRGDDLISMARKDKVWYYVSDGHGSTRALTDGEGRVTDTYRYDAWGNLLSRTGETTNEYLYTGEQYNAETGLYYLRARYMDPATGTFITMDSYAGSNSDPITLHKYLYANGNPVMNTDPSGHTSVADCNAAMVLNSVADQMMNTLLKKVMACIDVGTTCYIATRRMVTALLEGSQPNEILKQWMSDMIKGAAIGAMIGLACSSSEVLLGIVSAVGMLLQGRQIIEDWENGDYDLVVADVLQAVSMVSTLFMKCFTGDTLIAAEQGLTRIDEIKAGDYVLAENVETGEKAYKKVLKVYVKETTELVHLKTDGTKDEDQSIDTTANHPFYVDGKGWVAAVNLEEGDRLHTEDGTIVRVVGKEVEKLKKPIKVYNLEVEDFHTYYVTGDEVLVHNEYGKGKYSKINNSKIMSQNELSKEYFESLTNNGILKAGGRSGGSIPYKAKPNSYYITDKGHVIIYGESGMRIMDISSERIKIEKYNINPNNPEQGRWSERKLKDANGNVERTLQWILDYFGIGG